LLVHKDNTDLVYKGNGPIVYKALQ
jgi:hypothetical protein